MIHIRIEEVLVEPCLEKDLLDETGDTPKVALEQDTIALMCKDFSPEQNVLAVKRSASGPG